MTRSSKTTLLTTAFIVLLLVIDQASKIWVKTSMVEGEMHEITSWFKIYFVENEGMAYGITLGSKLLLTLFRILAMGAGVYYLVRLLRLRRFSLGFCLTLGLVIAGGLGNVIDCLFYGEIFSTSRGAVAQLVPWAKATAPSCMARWSICCTSRSSRRLIPRGVLSMPVSSSSSSARYSTSLMPASL